MGIAFKTAGVRNVLLPLIQIQENRAIQINLNNTYHHLPAAGPSHAPALGVAQRKVWARSLFLPILQVLHIILVSAGIFLPQPTLSTTYVLPPKTIQRARHWSTGSNHIVDPMAIQTRTVLGKARAAKADVASGLRPTRHRTRSASQSPTGKSVTAHLAAPPWITIRRRIDGPWSWRKQGA